MEQLARQLREQPLRPCAAEDDSSYSDSVTMFNSDSPNAGGNLYMIEVSDCHAQACPLQYIASDSHLDLAADSNTSHTLRRATPPLSTSMFSGCIMSPQNFTMRIMDLSNAIIFAE